MTTPRPDIMLVTHAALPGGAPDDHLLAGALQAKGMVVTMAAWDDHEVDWSAAPLAVVRSTWNYHRSPDRWRQWVASAARATTVLNGPEVLLWNTDKRYLRQLAAAGVECVPTLFIEPDMPVPLMQLAAGIGWHDIVVKPAIGASAAGTRRFSEHEFGQEGEQHLASLLRRGAVLLQAFVPAVETLGEHSLVFLGGAFSHAYTKPAFNADTTGTTAIAPYRPSLAELAFGAKVLRQVPGEMLYARVDLVEGEVGPMLMELELIEPDLGLRDAPRATSALASLCSNAHSQQGSAVTLAWEF